MALTLCGFNDCALLPANPELLTLVFSSPLFLPPSLPPSIPFSCVAAPCLYLPPCLPASPPPLSLSIYLSPPPSPSLPPSRPFDRSRVIHHVYAAANSQSVSLYTHPIHG